MKKMKLMWMLIAIAMMSFTFVSCDDDPWDEPWHDNGGWVRPGGNGGDNQVTTADEADALCGEWYGPVKYTYKNDNGGYDVTEFYANMRFSRYNTNSVNGVGTETDYTYNEDGSVADTQTLTFKWKILDNFDIQITYDGGGIYVLDANASQKGFALGYDDKSKKNMFSGYMIGTGDVQGNEIAFDFEAVAQTKTRASSIVESNKHFGINAIAPEINVAKGTLIKKR